MRFLNIWIFLLLCGMPWGKVLAVKIEKALIYNQYTLADTYAYGEKIRIFQWDKISDRIESVMAFRQKHILMGILVNYRNINRMPPLVVKASKNRYKGMQDSHGVAQSQGIPLYSEGDWEVPERYGLDGTLVALQNDSAGFFKVTSVTFGGEWWVPWRYVKPLGPVVFTKAVFVDRTNQNIATLEYTDPAWLVRSMNPATTGLNRPPYMHSTPSGTFVVQRKIPKMYFYKDGTTIEGGYAPYASRFSGGAYLHGVPVNYPRKDIIEYTASLGTSPRSHMCVRNATSHAEFIYDWVILNGTLVFVFD